MNPERWDRVKVIVQSLLEVPAAERPSILDRMCAGDAELRSEAESLLQADEEAGNFLIQSPPIPTTETQYSEAALSDGPIGPYRIVREIGSGGMGILYEAIRQDEFQKKVALKVIKSGMDSRAIVRRFQQERQILAGLDHPNITTLLDGGTTPDGRPYFVMEYVKGKLLDEYCDARKLPIRERLELFRTICSAVHYAHQNLVVHRDIKPGNILVTAEGVPKLLDFGIAKILNVGLTGTTIDLTAAAMRVMTPEYASPEQVRGDPITTATDVYSLGVLLYELLTGHRPYRLKTDSAQELASVVCEQEPEKPSTAVRRVDEIRGPGGTSRKITAEVVSATREGSPEQLRRRLRGDLDNIILKAMQKDPLRRYASVEQFAEDIRRHLNGLPVIARKDTAGYRAGKFVRRHKAGVAAATLIGLSLIAGIIGTAWQARVAARQRARAERRFLDVRKLANSVVFELHDAIENLPGATAARELLVRRALEYLDSLAAEAASDVSLQRELATAYERVASVQGEPSRPNLGNSQGARESLQKAAGIREGILAADPANRIARREVATVYGRLCELVVFSDRTGMPDYCRKSLAIREQLVAANRADAQARLDLATGYDQASGGLSANEDRQGALEYQRKALAIFKDLAEADPNSPSAQQNLARAHKHVGGTLGGLRQLDESFENYMAALVIEERLAAADPDNPQIRMGISYDLSDIGWIYLTQGELPKAEEYYQKALAIREALSAADPKDARVRNALGTTHDRLGYILGKLGQSAPALEQYRKALAIREDMVRSDPASVPNRVVLGEAYQAIGEIHFATAKNGNRKESWREAKSWLAKSLETFEALAARGALRASDGKNAAEVRQELAECEKALAGK